MSGDWIKMECNTPDKPEVLAITLKMGWDDPDLTVGKLFKLWRWFDQQTIDGNAPNVSEALLDRLIGVTGFVSAVASVGWLIITDGGITLPNFDRHNGKTAKTRALTAKRVAEHKNKQKGNDDGNGSGVTIALPREEKRREEKDISNPNGLLVDDPEKPLPDQPKIPPCPHNEIIALYHQHCPTMAKVKTWDNERQGFLRTRWRDNPKHQNLEFWERFFSYANDSPFLRGDVNGFKANLEWLVRPKNFRNVIEGKYHGDRPEH